MSPAWSLVNASPLVVSTPFPELNRLCLHLGCSPLQVRAGMVMGQLAIFDSQQLSNDSFYYYLHHVIMTLQKTHLAR